MITKTDALLSLRPNSKWVLRDGVLEWLDNDELKPTEVELQAEVSRLQAEYDAQEYARSRAVEYPAIGDQLDDLFHAGLFSDEMMAKIQAIKDKYPKA